MTNREAISTEIEPYSLSDEAYETAFIKAKAHFGIENGVDDVYTQDMIPTVAYAGMICLAKLLTLTNENVGGVSQSYNPTAVKGAIKALAQSAGLSASLVLDDDSDDYGLQAVHVW